MTRKTRRNLRNGLLFVSPWLVGFLALQVYPILYSLRMSFTDYSGFNEMVNIGFKNFVDLFKDDLFWKSAYNTLYYTVLAVPIGVVVAIVLALAMNQKVREVPVYRAILYIPSILPVFALSLVWIVFLNPRFGLLNRMGGLIHLPRVDMLGDPSGPSLPSSSWPSLVPGGRRSSSSRACAGFRAKCWNPRRSTGPVPSADSSILPCH